jgi:hypothetical protein
MIKEPPRMGTCYFDVYQYFTNECDIPGALLVHGILYGKDDLTGWIYGHAWIELGDVCMQPVVQDKDKTYGLGFINRKEVFYELYKIDEKMVRRYKIKEVFELSAKYKTYGPWHELGLGEKGYIYKP